MEIDNHIFAINLLVIFICVFQSTKEEVNEEGIDFQFTHENSQMKTEDIRIEGEI